MSLFFCLCSTSMGQYCQKSLVNKGGWSYRKGAAYRRGDSNLMDTILTLGWLLGLHNTSLDAKFRVQNLSFC